MSFAPAYLMCYSCASHAQPTNFPRSPDFLPTLLLVAQEPAGTCIFSVVAETRFDGAGLSAGSAAIHGVLKMNTALGCLLLLVVAGLTNSAAGCDHYYQSRSTTTTVVRRIPIPRIKPLSLHLDLQLERVRDYRRQSEFELHLRRSTEPMPCPALVELEPEPAPTVDRRFEFQFQGSVRSR